MKCMFTHAHIHSVPVTMPPNSSCCVCCVNPVLACVPYLITSVSSNRIKDAPGRPAAVVAAGSRQTRLMGPSGGLSEPIRYSGITKLLILLRCLFMVSPARTSVAGTPISRYLWPSTPPGSLPAVSRHCGGCRGTAVTQTLSGPPGSVFCRRVPRW